MMSTAPTGTAYAEHRLQLRGQPLGERHAPRPDADQAEAEHPAGVPPASSRAIEAIEALHPSAIAEPAARPVSS